MIKIQNQTIPIEIIDNKGVWYLSKDVIVTIITIIGTILSVVIGFLLSTYSTKLRDKKNNYKAFLIELIRYSKGNENLNDVLFYYKQLSSKNKKFYIDVLNLKNASPDERKRIINKLLNK